MNKEILQQQSFPEVGVNGSSKEIQEKQKPRHLMYIPGMPVKQSEVANTVLPVFAKAYGGSENITLFNSALSPDVPNPQRYEQMADTIISSMEHGQGIDILAASLGSTELWRALKIVEDRQPGFFENQTDKSKLRIVLLGPSGFSVGKDKLMYPFKIAKLMSKEEQGTETFATFPPEAEVVQRVANLLAADTNVQDGFSKQTLAQMRTNRQFLDEAEQALLSAYDAELVAALDESNPEAVKENLKKRGSSHHRAVLKVYRGTTDEEEGKKNEDRIVIADAGINTPKQKRGVRETVGLLARANGTKPMQEYQRLIDIGYEDQIGFIVPGYDTVFPLKKVVAFFGDIDKARKNTVVTEIGNHSVFHAQPEVLIKGVLPQETTN